MRTERETIMILSRANLTIAGFVIATAFSVGPVHAQGPAGTWVFHSGASGACPGLDWHVTSDGRALSGFIAWDHGKSLARVTGTLTGTDAKMTAVEVGGGRTANITGRIEGGGNTLAATIAGMGGPCDGKTVRIPWMSSTQMGGQG
jgi:hypothetical protein